MKENKHERTLQELFAVFREKSTVFCYKDNPKASGVVMKLVREMEKKDKLPVIRICWNENELKDGDFNGNTNSFYIFRNFTTTLIKIEKLISQRKHLILVSDISNLEAEQNSNAYIRFMSILLRKNEEYECSLITMFSERCADQLIKTKLTPHFNNYFSLSNERIINEKEKLPDIKYSIRKNRLYLESYLQDDMNKIKDIFALTPEEKKELDQIVGQSLEEYRTSM